MSLPFSAYLRCNLPQDEVICDQLGGNVENANILVKVPSSNILKWFSYM